MLESAIMINFWRDAALGIITHLMLENRMCRPSRRANNNNEESLKTKKTSQFILQKLLRTIGMGV
jgi:hypothetical protein